MSKHYNIITNINNLPNVEDLIVDFDKKIMHLGDAKSVINNVDDLNKYHKKNIDVITKGDKKLIKKIKKYKSDNSFSSIILDKFVTNKLEKLLGLEYAAAKIHRQTPQTLGLYHVDNLGLGYIYPKPKLIITEIPPDKKLTFELDNKSVVRFFIFLEDHYPGQGVLFNEELLIKWKKGDVVYWDWQETMHMTFNGSYWDRYLIRIDGFKTPLTDDILNKKYSYLNY